MDNNSCDECGSISNFLYKKLYKKGINCLNKKIYKKIILCYYCSLSLCDKCSNNNWITFFVDYYYHTACVDCYIDNKLNSNMQELYNENCEGS